MDSSIGRFWRSTPNNNDWPLLNEHLVTPATPSPADRMLRTNTFGRTTPQWKAPGSNSVPSHLNEIHLKIGPPSKITLSEGGWKIYRLKSSLEITGPSEQLLLTLLSQLQCNELLMFSGVQLASGSLDEHGKKQVLMRIPSVLCPSFGMATEVIRTLSLMNSVEGLTSVTSSDGSTDIQLSLMLKDPQLSCRQPIFGSPATCIQETGTLI